MQKIYTIGHSAQTINSFLVMLQLYRIELLADVRSIPASRWHPHFGRTRLEASLQDAGIRYVHMPALGGRHAVPFEEYTGTPAFIVAAATLETLAREHRIAFMCAEADPKNCHRLHIANQLHEAGWQVLHILKGGAIAVHPNTTADGQRGLFD